MTLPACETCDGTGWVIAQCDDDIDRVARCHCFKFDATALADRAGIPKRFQDLTLEHIRDDYHGAAARLAPELIDLGPTSLFLSGPPGTGKTSLFCAYGLQLIGQGVRLRYFDEHSLALAFRDTYRDAAELSESEVLADLRALDLLIIDDGARERKASSWFAEIVFSVVNARYNDERPVVVVSNYSFDTLADRWGDVVASRLRQMCGKGQLHKIDKDEPDYRRTTE